MNEYLNLGAVRNTKSNGVGSIMIYKKKYY